MSHVAVILTSDRCGHCRSMRGAGRLLSQNEIKRDNKPANIPGGFHYDAKFMKKLITANMDKDTKLRVININYRTFNPTEGVMDISVFTLEPDGNTIRQTMLMEKDGKSVVNIYLVGDSGQVVTTQEMPNSWSDLVKNYIPSNISMYSMFFPSLILFEGSAWTEGIKNGTPIFGHLNGFESKTEAPYGVAYKPGVNPNVMNFPNYIEQFFNGSKELGLKSVQSPAKPVNVEKPETVPEKIIEIKNEVSESNKPVNVPGVLTAGAKNKFKFKLYVVEK